MSFPNPRITLYADSDAVTRYESKELKEERLHIIQSPMKFTVGGQWTLFKNHSSYFLEFWVRVFIMISFPLGLVISMSHNIWKVNRLILGLPLIFIILSASLIRLPNFDHIVVGWGAVFVVVIEGLSKQFSILLRRIKSP